MILSQLPRISYSFQPPLLVLGINTIPTQRLSNRVNRGIGERQSYISSLSRKATASQARESVSSARHRSSSRLSPRRSILCKFLPLAHRKLHWRHVSINQPYSSNCDKNLSRTGTHWLLYGTTSRICSLQGGYLALRADSTRWFDTRGKGSMAST